MRKALLLYNPVAGRKRSHRLAQVQSASAVLQSGGIETAIEATEGSEATAGQVRKAIGTGFDTIFACGGDGTIHDIVQGLAGTQTVLGVIPLGTANSLACDLKIPFRSERAARLALLWNPQAVALGRVKFHDRSGQLAERFFISIAGMGVDAYVLYRLLATTKNRFGISAYYLESLRQWLLHHKAPFHVRLSVSGSSLFREEDVSQLLAVRIADFGGALRRLAPGAGREHEDCRLVLFHTRSRVRYLQYVLRCMSGGGWNTPGTELLYSSSVSADYLSPRDPSQRVPIFVQADGELLGTLPAQITVEPKMLNLLAP